jgi:glycerophosphoryl diester phosphodiesterase
VTVAAGLVVAGLACLAAAADAAPPRSVLIAAHRGLSESVPENTLEAFRRSIARGVPIIELDLRVTADGELVVLHDRTLDRTTDCTGKVSAMALARVEACGVPTFAEVVALVRGTPVRILADVKDGTPLAPVLEAVREQHAERQVILGLRSIDHVARARAALPETTILAFMPRVGDAPAFARVGAQIIRLWSDWVEADPALVVRTRAFGAQVWVLAGPRLPRTEPEWRALHGRMLRLGPDGLITDRPEWVPAMTETAR